MNDKFKEYFAEQLQGLNVVLEKYTPSISADKTATFDYSFVGNRADIGILANICVVAGAAIHADYDGSGSRLNASFNYYPGNFISSPPAEVPVEKYSVSFSGVTISLFALPAARKEAKLFNSTYKKDFAPSYKGTTDADTIYRNYREHIQWLADRGDSFDLSDGKYAGLFPFGLTIYRSIIYGIDSETVIRPTLKRTRYYSFSFAEKRKITYALDVSTTNALIRLYFIPLDIIAVLPSDPIDADTPPDSTWAWKITDQTLEYSKPKRAWEEHVVFEFAAFDNNLYRINT